VSAVAEAAAAGEGRDVVERLFDRRLVGPELQLTHAGRVDEQRAAGQLDQLP
jgi:hypothetical protein